MIYDFLIVGLPRSGTHMLATALNDHPDISCRREDAQPLYAHCTGRVFTRINDLPEAKKHIVITRPYADRLRSWNSTGTRHSNRPWREAGPGLTSPLPDDHQRLLNFARQVDALVLAYDRMTHGIHIDELPYSVSLVICDYLGVEFRRLHPGTHKPNQRKLTP